MSFVAYDPPYYSTIISSTITTSGNYILTTGLTNGSVNYPQPEPVRRKTELDWLDEQVNKVCALAR